MAKSLQEQLIAAGLASTSQAKKAEKQKRAEAQARKQRKKGSGAKGNAGKGAADGSGSDKRSQGSASQAEPTAAQRARRAQSAKAKRDQELARERNARASKKAQRAQIKQLIAQHDQRKKAAADTDVTYNFVHNRKIKRIYVPPVQKEQLSKGELLIINNDGLYHLVTPEIAARIAERDPKWIISEPAGQRDEPEMDDHYKQFEVPDDLDW